MSNDSSPDPRLTTSRALDDPLGAAASGVKGGEKALGGSGVMEEIPEPVRKLFGPLEFVLEYGQLVLGEIVRIQDTPAMLGYSEGYARVLTYRAFGRDPASLPFVGYYGGPTVYASAQELPNQPQHPEVKKGLAFFKGKADAMHDLNISGPRRGPEEYLNECFRQITKGRGIAAAITKLRYYTDGDIGEIKRSR